MERQEGQGELLLLLFSDVFPRTPRRFQTSPRLDRPQNNGADSTPGFKGLIAADSAWPGRSGAGRETRV